MRYFLKKTYPSKKGLYLQIYQSNYIPGKGGRNKSFEALGYYEDLIKQGIEDPIKYAQEKIELLNSEIPSKKEKKIGDTSANKNVGYFLLKSMIDYIDPDEFLAILSNNKKFHFKLSDFIRSMIYAQVVNPGSKHKAFEKVMPNIFGIETFTYDQILDTINYVGDDYQKFIEIFNIKIAQKRERKVSNTYFDCTNYYFEIDLPYDDKQFGPSKEERHLPIIGQSLLLDEDQIPLGMSLFPGNQSEKPKLRDTIEDLKSRFQVSGKIVQVADKGLNCARNIYAACVEANDGYIFSKSIHGRNLSDIEKKWVLLDNDQNIWTEVNDKNGKLLYKYKECIDVYEYKFKDDDGREIKFRVKEKRVVSYNPSLARKQIAQIQKQIDKAKAISTWKQANKDDFGESIKYVKYVGKDDENGKTRGKIILNQATIDEDLKFAGYNLLISSETKKSGREIYNIYHGLWRIEESFRVMKTYLEARPTYLQKPSSIYGHFTICYLALTILRLLEIKVFEDELPIGQIVEFIRNYNVTETLDGSFMNNATKSEILTIIKKKFGLSKLDNFQLTKRDIKSFLDASFDY